MSVNNALEPFLLLAKSARGAAAARLVSDALAAPGVLVFGELLELAGIAELESSAEYAKFHRLLKLFSFGTYADYKANASQLPELNTAQLKKLRLLTIVSLAYGKKTIPYQLLADSLDISSLRELEDLIIDAIYGGMVDGKMDQKAGAFVVEYAMGRDLRPGQVEEMIAVLEKWEKNSQQILAALETQIKFVSATATANKNDNKAFAKEYENSLSAARSASKMSSGWPGPSNYHSVEYVTEESSRSKIGKGPKPRDRMAQMPARR